MHILENCPICRGVVGYTTTHATYSVYCGTCDFMVSAFPKAHLDRIWSSLPRPCIHEWEHVEDQGYSAPSSVRCSKCGATGEMATHG